MKVSFNIVGSEAKGFKYQMLVDGCFEATSISVFPTISHVAEAIRDICIAIEKEAVIDVHILTVDEKVHRLFHPEEPAVRKDVFG